jgi:acetyl-CoA carboxylase biotin carboxyl carrier protein
MELTEDDVLEILKLFEQSKFDFLQLEQGERKITVSKGGYQPAPTTTAAHAQPATAPSPGPAAASQPAPAETAAIPAGLAAIPAPMVGKFYAAPSPSDPPFVTAGTRVEAGTTIGLIEVMKVFTSIKTEIAGTIARILVTNGEMVEFGQPLFLIKAD